VPENPGIEGPDDTANICMSSNLTSLVDEPLFLLAVNRNLKFDPQYELALGIFTETVRHWFSLGKLVFDQTVAQLPPAFPLN
jgi:hypothetical protein